MSTVLDSEPNASADVAPRNTVRNWWPATALAAAIGTLAFAFAHTALIDDAYITLDFARNVAFHLHWGMDAGLTANTATSPLNVLLIALFTAISRSPVVGLGVVHVLSVVAVEFGVRNTARVAGLPRWTGLLAVVLFSVNPLLIASTGMEIALAAGLLALLLAASATNRPVWLGLLSGLLVLTRPDLVILVPLVFLIRPARWRGWWRSLLGALAVTVPWYLWSWMVLGSAVPDTLIIKTGEHSWGVNTFGNGPRLYYQAYPNAALLSFLPAALAVVAALGWVVARLARPTEGLRRLDRFAVLPVAGVAHYLAYSALGVPPYHWYYGPALASLGIFLAAAVGALLPIARVPAFAGLAGVAALLAFSINADVAAGVPSRVAPITTNWATAEEYAAAGRELGRLVGDRSVRSAGEIGALAYYCDCRIVDEFADPAYTDQSINARIAATRSGITRKLLTWNFHFRDRTAPPARPDFQLRFGDARPADAVAGWTTDSPWNGKHVLSLVPNR